MTSPTTPPQTPQRRPRPMGRVFAPLAVALTMAASTVAIGAERPVLDTVDEWPLPNQDYQNTRAAPEPVIDSSNVDELAVAWTMDIPGEGPYGAAAGGLVVDEGVVYFQDLGGNIFALILENGEVIWQHEGEASLVGPTGPAIDGRHVYASLDDATFGALDIASGEVAWSVEPETGYLGAIQPMFYEDTVYYATQAGKSGEAGYAAGQSGVVHAADAATGEDRWAFQVVEEGYWGMPEVNAGGGVWYPPAIDTEAKVTFWGTGNPAPFPGTAEHPNGSSRPGPNLYTSSVIALEHQGGDLKWYYQAVEHDLFDHDFQVSPILASIEVEGQSRDLVIGSGKVGDVVAIDRQTQEPLWRTEVGRHQNDDLEALPTGEEIEVLPGILGGVETPMAYADGMVYVPVVNIPTTHSATGYEAADGTEALANANERTPVDEGTGALVAIDAASGEIVWQQDFEAPVFAGATVSGDLVFTATYDGVIRAFERMSGEPLWSYEAPAGINAWPAIAADTIVWPAGVGSEPRLIALRLGAGESSPEAASPSPDETVMPAPQTAAPTTSSAPASEPPATSEPTAEASEPTAEATEPPAAGSEPPDTSEPTAEATEPAAVTELTLVAQNTAFDTDQITVSAGANVRLTLENRDPIPHNFALYRTDAAEESIFVGETFSGPGASQTYEFTAPSEPGEYFFRCDVHPQLMTGTLVVE